MTKIETITELKKLGVEFDPNAKASDLAELLKISTEDGDSKEQTGGKVLVWLKTRAYIADRQRIDAGVYLVSADKITDRLKKLGASDCVIYQENDVPVELLSQIVKFHGIDASKMKAAELTEKVMGSIAISEFKTIKS